MKVKIEIRFPQVWDLSTLYTESRNNRRCLFYLIIYEKLTERV